MALALFSKRLLQQVVLHAHLSIHLLETPVLFGHVLHLCDEGGIHAAKLGPPLVEAGAAHPMLSAKLRDGRTPSACFKMPIICASLYRAVFIVNLLRYLAEKILLLNTTNFRGDYQVSWV